MKLEKAKVIDNKCIASNIYKMDIEVNYEKVNAGQFIHIKVGKTNRFMLRRPISICKVDNNLISIIYRINGEGTKYLSNYKENDYIDILGPLGNGYNLDEIKGNTIALFGGGIGVPPMYELAIRLKNKGFNVISILGFQSKKDIFLKEEFENISKTIITTVDGSYGIKGYVTDALKKEEFDSYCACGPDLMLKALQKLYKDKQGFISIENRMACGVGACYACICNKEEDYTRVCIEGPVYKANEVIL